MSVSELEPNRPEEVILFIVYHFNENKSVLEQVRRRFPRARIIWHTVQRSILVDEDFTIPEGLSVTIPSAL